MTVTENNKLRDYLQGLCGSDFPAGWLDFGIEEVMYNEGEWFLFYSEAPRMHFIIPVLHFFEYHHPEQTLSLMQFQDGKQFEFVAGAAADYRQMASMVKYIADQA